MDSDEFYSARNPSNPRMSVSKSHTEISGTTDIIVDEDVVVAIVVAEVMVAACEIGRSGVEKT